MSRDLSNASARGVLLGTWIALGALSTACEAPIDTRESLVTTSGAPLEKLGAAESSRFYEGLREFSEVESAAEGLGPLFNASSCGHCHVDGGLGGGGNTRVTRVACRTTRGELVIPPSGSLLHTFSTRPDIAGPRIAAGCNAVLSQRRTTNVLGAGLIEAIADAEILSEATQQEGGVAGRAAHVTDDISGKQRIGRFGWKAQHATLDAFAADAYRGELGITNEVFDEEIPPAGEASLLSLMDPLPDPEARVGAVASLADFMRFSAPPAVSRDVPAGLETFQEIGCANCHREYYETRRSSAVGARKVRLFSDLLLHEIGTGDGILQADAGPDELRTAPLWGLGRASLFLHDGSQASIEGAVRAHAGQASDAQDAFAALSMVRRIELLQFLEAL